MRVLIVKTSSMGDVIHTLPALTDAGKMIPGITFDWVVEENFSEIPHWHPLVNKVIPMAWRRWRKQLFSATTRTEWFAFQKELRNEKYDLIIDAQGLVKSAFFSFLAKGRRCGPNWKSAREAVASLFYQRTATVDKNEHAVTRMRLLFSQALKYVLPTTIADYGIDRQSLLTGETKLPDPYLVFLHGTTWVTKHWPEKYWIELTHLANQAGYRVSLPWGNQAERERAERIALACKSAEVLPRLGLVGIAKILAGATAIAAVDTGLGHLAAALDVPTVSLYGPTNPVLTGALGKSQVHLAAKFSCAPCLSKVCTYESKVAESTEPLFPPCFSVLTPTLVWDSLTTLL
jgi:heptosyltransferase-1